MAGRHSDMTFLKAIDAAKFLGVTISDFLDGVRSGKYPQPEFMGVGNRWNLLQLETWKHENQRRHVSD